MVYQPFDGDLGHHRFIMTGEAQALPDFLRRRLPHAADSSPYRTRISVHDLGTYPRGFDVLRMSGGYEHAAGRRWPEILGVLARAGGRA